ncbi:hypothetical protein GCM10023085_44900 [Actinomadura viridis]|uniref:Uncharacterized protein n=1 Tax=Actinomadura viridis TaxID=58110 RepID=A0A931GK28_9ACTN|nr:hypothetical protein [Actinomadura viridis]MBG6089852.1 hypothetical protein [Actinomadura viridis]
MDPVSALITACALAWFVTRGAVDAASAQAGQEARVAAAAIQDDLRRRREAWAKRLADRVAGGRAGGPATALWWAWAAARTAQAVRRGLRREPRAGERARELRGETGPFRRIWDAGVNGARFARQESRRQRHTEERHARVPLGVCGRCGTVVARRSLAPDPADASVLVCVLCRGAAKPTQPDTEKPAGPAPELVDAKVVDADATGDTPRLIDPPRPGGDSAPPPPPPVLPSPPEPPTPAPVPETPQVPAAPQPAAVPAANTREIEEGEPMPPRQPGQIVPRRHHAPSRTAGHAPARANGGESYTHGQWNRAVADIHKQLDALPAALELMLRRLTVADAGRSQVRGVLQLHDDIVQFMGQVTDMLREVNRIEQPVLAAVEAAGGTEEIAGIPYLSDV